MLDDTLDGRAARLNDRYRHHAATEVLRRAVSDADLGRVALVSSFGAESVVLLHMVSVVAPGLPVLFIDTQMLFPETLDYQREVANKLGLTNVQVIRAIRPRSTGWTPMAHCISSTPMPAAICARPCRWKPRCRALTPGSRAASAFRAASGPSLNSLNPSRRPGCASTRWRIGAAKTCRIT